MKKILLGVSAIAFLSSCGMLGGEKEAVSKSASQIICERKGGEWSQDICSGVDAEVCALMNGELNGEMCKVS